MNLIKKIIHIPRNLAILLIKFYQKYFSFDHSEKLKALKQTNEHYKYRGCKYYPSCSEYTKQAISRFGLIIGGVLGVWRILRCNPWSHGGFDPVPEKLFKKKNTNSN